MLIILLESRGFCLFVFWFCPGWVAKLVRASSCTPKDCRFNPRSEHIPRLLEHIPGFDPRSGHVVLIVCFEKETTIRIIQSIELSDKDFKAMSWPVWLSWLERCPTKLRVAGSVDVSLSH